MQDKKLVRAVADSLTRLNGVKDQVASSVDSGSVSRQVKNLSNPASPSSTLKKVGFALIVGTPDPVTAVPGVALLAASVAAKRREPTKLDDLAAETRKILRDIESLRL
ncbi:MAG: hypothetical protein JRN06_04420 [Nitrososphaerota archaeon]|nr:hypothetical protein [Nitrososphaerota archaeon]MDG7023866.1 hypothetical protein [Nitrososphaerota archaeon]